MGKPKRERSLADNEALAVATLLRTSPRKLDLVAGLIRGLDAGRAVIALEFSRKRIAQDVRKTLQSAIANAENNHNLDVDRLFVAEASVGKHLVMKRMHARARGRSGRIEKYVSRLRIVVRERVDEPPAKRARITIHTARPGVVIGKKGQEIEVLRKELAALTSGDVHLNINEVRKPELDAKLIAENIAQQLNRRVTFRRAMKRAVQSAMRLGAQGIKVACGGRLGGAEIARSEWYREGRVPLHTLRANVDFARATAHTPYGTCGSRCGCSAA